jgi:hypothetical protein
MATQVRSTFLKSPVQNYIFLMCDWFTSGYVAVCDWALPAEPLGQPVGNARHSSNPWMALAFLSSAGCHGAVSPGEERRVGAEPDPALPGGGGVPRPRSRRGKLQEPLRTSLAQWVHIGQWKTALGVYSKAPQVKHA